MSIRFAFPIQTVLSLVLLLAFGAEPMRAALVPTPSVVARANNAFAVDLYGRLRANDGNLFFSPYSISLAFGMVGVGGGGATAEQIRHALHLDGPPAGVAAGQGGLQRRLNEVQANGKVQLAIANSIWPERTYPFRADYLRLLATHYQVSVTPCDFLGDADVERERINQWVEDHTNERIQDLLPWGSLDAATRLVLANAVYFKGYWKEPFRSDSTRERPFTTVDHGEVRVPMMMRKGSFGYAHIAGLQLLAMPYEGGELSMVVLLPDRPDGVSALESTLSAEELGNWLDELRQMEVVVHFPKFKAASSFNLKQTMQALGVTDAFVAGQADFSSMTERNDLFISDAVHKAFVEVNEEGTEAAAATGVVMSLAAASTAPPVFQADHPFLYLIRHDRTGAILFMGRMANPRDGS